MGLSTLFMSCAQQNDDRHDDHAHQQDDTPQRSAQTNAAVSLKNEKLDAIYPHYIQLTEALTAGDISKAKVAALAIEAGARHVKGAAKLAAAAANITAAGNLDAQRVMFSELNTSFIHLLKASGTDSGVLYITHCPMALNDQGAYWVSQDKAIRNPYFGDRMLTCGSVKETI